MLTEHSRSWTHQWKAEGLKEGLKEGIQKGHQEGASAILVRQLQRKFGTLTPSREQQLKQATPAQLEAWSLNILNAATLDDVFTD